MNKEIEIPEGYKARIEGNKVIFESKDSEDERMRKGLIRHLKELREWKVGSMSPIKVEECYDAWIAYLEKQKEHPKEELVYRLNGLMQDYIKEGKDEEEKEHRFKCYQLFWDALEDANFFEQKEQKPNIKLIQRSWYMEGYHDREFGQEPKWIIKTGEGGPKYEKNEKYGQPLEQKPVEWSEEDSRILYNVIAYVGYAAGQRGVRDDAFKEANDWLKSLPKRFNSQPKAEWSEDERLLNIIIDILDKEEHNGHLSHDDLKNCVKLIKSFRPKSHWKPSEEQMQGLWRGIVEADKGSYAKYTMILLYNDLKKLM